MVSNGSNGELLEIAFDRVYHVTRLSTTGVAENGHVTRFHISYSSDGLAWQHYNGTEDSVRKVGNGTIRREEGRIRFYIVFNYGHNLLHDRNFIISHIFSNFPKRSFSWKST